MPCGISYNPPTGPEWMGVTENYVPVSKMNQPPHRTGFDMSMQSRFMTSRTTPGAPRHGPEGPGVLESFPTFYMNRFRTKFDLNMMRKFGCHNCN